MPPEASTGMFETALADDVDGFFDLGGGHVVEQQRFGAMIERQVEFGEIAHFDVDGLSGLAAFFGAGEDLLDATAERDVIVLDENAVGEIEAMVFAAAATNGVFVEDAQAGYGLACIEDFGAGVAGSRQRSGG